jgi:23S rRNA-/tRNA-specific pseudouridylate synthase
MTLFQSLTSILRVFLKGTTGCLILPLDHRFTKTISQQFLQNTVNKTYLALVHMSEKVFRASSGRIEDPITYGEGCGRISRNGKKAVTEWELVGSSVCAFFLKLNEDSLPFEQPKAPLSLLRLKLLTGNKHQLRIHLAECLGG